jgi:hypothetical protein
MNTLLRLATLPLAVICCMGFVFTTMPAAYAAPPAKEDWCFASASSAVKACGFASLEQCRATQSGIGGSCYRASSRANTSNAHASARGRRAASRELSVFGSMVAPMPA